MSPTAPLTTAARTAALLGAEGPASSRPVSGGSIAHAHAVTLSDGRLVFAKTLPGAPEGFFRAEATGLRLLRSTGTVPVPDVLAVAEDMIVLDWLEPTEPTSEQAEQLGRELAALHLAPAPHYGTAHPAWIGSLPLPSPAAGHPVTSPEDWPDFHVGYRLLPYLQQATDNGAICGRDAAVVEEVCARFGELAGPPPPPSVIHGDLWSGNVHWSPHGRAYLLDPAAQGGHPEADLAMLALFGCPRLDRILSAYAEVSPLPGRAGRAPLHQLHPLLVHAVLFGGGYGARAGDAARRALAV